MLEKPYPRRSPSTQCGFPRILATTVPGNNCSYTNSTTLLPAGAAFAPASTAPVSGPSRVASGLIDTVIVVNGITVPFAGASSIQDAIYNGNRRELYLTNPAFNRVEVFQVANTTFVAGGITTAGGQPWGIALWKVSLAEKTWSFTGTRARRNGSLHFQWRTAMRIIVSSGK